MREKRTTGADPEETILYALLVAIGSIPVVIAVASRAAFGFDSTLGLLMVTIGVVGVCVQLARFLRRRNA